MRGKKRTTTTKKKRSNDKAARETKPRNIKKTESLRGGTVFRRAKLLETEKLNHAKVAGASNGRSGAGRGEPVCVDHLGEHDSLTGAYVGWSREKLRHSGISEESRLSKKTARQGRQGIRTIYL